MVKHGPISTYPLLHLNNVLLQCLINLWLWEVVPRSHIELIIKIRTDLTSPSGYPPFILDSTLTELK